MVIYAGESSFDNRFGPGELYRDQDNGVQDYRQAARRYEQAAIDGSRRAQHRLATFYARGQGVTQDYARAYAWCKVAVFQDSKCARRKLGIIEARMSLQQLRRGRWLAQDYYDRFPADTDWEKVAENWESDPNNV